MGEFLTVSSPSHPQLLIDGMWRLFEDKFETDCEIVSCENSQRQQQLFKAHYLVLSVFCPFIKQSGGKKFVLDIGTEELQCFLEFIYRGRVEINEERLGKVRSGAEKLGLKLLIDCIDKCVLNQRKNHRHDECSSKRNVKGSRKTIRQTDDTTVDDGRRNKRSRNISRDKKYFHSSEDEDNEESAEEFVPSADEPSDSDKLNLDNLSCKICSKTYKSVRLLRQHVRRLHQFPTNFKHCSHCTFKADSKSKLIRHLASKHEMDMDGHLLEKTFKCSDCDFACVAEFRLKVHLKQKHGFKSHKCDRCSYATNSKTDLAKHREGVHNNTRPFICETCGFAAKSSSNLHLHMTIHKEKVVCEICGVTVKHRAIRRHVETLHGENRNKVHCHLCSLVSRDKYNLKAHLIKVHKIPSESVETIIKERIAELQASSLTIDPVVNLQQTFDPSSMTITF